MITLLSSCFMKTIFISFLLINLSGHAFGALNEELKDIARKHKNTVIGIEILELQSGKQVASLNPNKPLNPASVAKIVTAVPALDFLRPEYTFKTEFYLSGIKKENKLKGDIFIKAGGDPVFVTEYMYILADEISRKGFLEVEGNIVFDTSFFKMNSDEYESGFIDNQAYNAIPSPLVFNFNTTTIYVRPGKKINDPLIVSVDPENSYIKIINTGKTSNNTHSLKIIKGKKGEGFETYMVSGKMPLLAKTRRFYKKVEKPGVYFAQVFKDFLLKKNIHVKGEIARGNVPSSAKLFLTKESRPLSFIIKDLFTFSNNVLAENIVRTMGHVFDKNSNSENAGLKVIKKYMSEKAGIDLSKVFIDKGSGLSRKNRISASDVNKVILSAKNDFSIYPEFLNALCVSGTTGTLKDLYKGNIKERIRAKTGSLNGVASLSGIYKGKDQEYVFTLLVNSNSSLYLRGVVSEIMKKIGEIL